MGKKIIYLDNGATTAVNRGVAREMQKYMLSDYGNPGSPHALGEKAQKDMNDARKKIAREIGAKPWEIIFTSGGTEANNLALFGSAKANSRKKKIIISSIEHSSVYEPSLELKKRGYEIVEIPVDNDGLINIDEIEKEIDEKTLLVSIIHANNEIGVLQDLRKIGNLCKKKKVLFHTDAVQSFAKEKINVHDMGIDLLSASGHKISGPKGIGFLYVREGLEPQPIIIGGGQERGMRGGTENVPAIMSFSKALEIAKREDKKKIRELRDYFADALEQIGGKINGDREKRICNNVNVSLPCNAENLVLYLSEKGIYCSTKSACLSREHRESRVLKALDLGDKEINGSIRFGLSASIGKKDIDFVVREIAKITKKV